MTSNNVLNTETLEEKSKRLEQDRLNEQSAVNKQKQNLEAALNKHRKPK